VNDIFAQQQISKNISNCIFPLHLPASPILHLKPAILQFHISQMLAVLWHYEKELVIRAIIIITIITREKD